MEKNVLMQESEIDRMNREAKANFDRYYEAYLESPEFVMCECVKGISMSVQELLDLLKPTLADVDPRYAEALKTYVTWIKNTENEAAGRSPARMALDGETQFWNAIAQAAKTSHGRKVHEELAPVAIPTGWW